MLAKQYRLRTTNDFKGVFKKGRGVTVDGLLVKVRKAGQNQPRLGIVVSKKVAKKAVTRNRIRRVLGEAIRPHMDKIRTPVDIVVVVLPGFRLGESQDTQKTIRDLLKKASLLQ